ncbi:DUF6879 family protein [Nonomuraea sp. NPDC049714]|uniref:DUF6879 family protein n=1 Tax=Nonomuraea sp. NPDC049714 TaxID=3364357 RepID=UPI00378E7880
MALYPPTKYRRLSITAGGVDDFMKFFTGLRTSWVKIEFLQEYDESGFAGYDAFKNGNYDEAATLVREMVMGQRELYGYAAEHKISMTRIRVCELPLSPYLKHYEFAAYLADIECGEDIRLVRAADVSRLLDDTGMSDFVLFDHRRVIALIYDLHTGSLREARLVEDTELVRAYSAVADELTRVSVPMLQSSIYLDSVGRSFETARCSPGQ